MAAKRGRVTHRAALVAAAAVMGAGLSGCGGLGKALGVSKNSPDEFAVVSKAPLVLPPDYELRPPKPGAERPQETNPTEAAKQALFRNSFGQPGALPATATAPAATAAGASAAPATPAQPDNRILVTKSEDFANRLMFGNAAAPGGEGEVQKTSAEKVDEKEKPVITKKVD